MNENTAMRALASAVVRCSCGEVASAYIEWPFNEHVCASCLKKRDNEWVNGGKALGPTGTIGSEFHQPEHVRLLAEALGVALPESVVTGKRTFAVGVGGIQN